MRYIIESDFCFKIHDENISGLRLHYITVYLFVYEYIWNHQEHDLTQYISSIHGLRKLYVTH